jgi:hypothetical protein
MPVFVEVGATVVVVVLVVVEVAGATVEVAVVLSPSSVTTDSSPLGVHANVTAMKPNETKSKIIDMRRDCSATRTGVATSTGVHVVPARSASAVSG